MSKQIQHLRDNQTQLLLGAQAQELVKLRAKLLNLQEALEFWQLLLAWVVRDNPVDVDMSSIQLTLKSKQINIKKIDELHLQVYLTDKPCDKCGQTPQGQSDEHPCPKCGLPMVWDDADTSNSDNLAGTDSLQGQQK